jgi:uncharacterized membrane protein YjgN (DUF898 family)
LASQQITGVGRPAELPFRFTGNASEYFRIWIVNLCLTVLTLGLYAPWAKVRTRRYFAANLAIEGSAFDYDADPARILIGRLVVLAAFAAYALAELFAPPVSFALAAASLFLFPAAAVRSTAFHHRHTLFRSIRFGFAARYGDAAFVLVVAPLIASFTLGLALPWWYARHHAFVAKHSRYGTSGFHFQKSTRSYYHVFARATLLSVSALVLGGVAFSLLGAPSDAGFPLLAAGVPTFCALGLATAIVKAGVTNLLYHNARVGDLRFRSEMRAGSLAWLYATNVLGVVLSLGLATPWARVRLAHYRASTLTLVAPHGLDAFTQASERAGGLGELASEAADLFDFDLGL